MDENPLLRDEPGSGNSEIRDERDRTGGAEFQFYTNTKCTWLIQSLQALDASLVATSMAEFLRAILEEEEGEDTFAMHVYGLSISLFWIGRLMGLPLFGRWADSRGFLPPFVFALSLGTVGGLLYSIAGVDGKKLFWLVPLSRFVLGTASGVVSALMAFTVFSAKTGQTKHLGFQLLVYNCASIVSPLVASVISLLPEWSSGPHKILTKFTYCGYFISLSNFVVLIVLIRNFRDPWECSTGESQSTTNSPENSCLDSGKKLFKMGARVLSSGAWVSFILSCQNNLNQTLVEWTLPLISKKVFGWTLLENGFLFGGIGCFGAVATLTAVNLSENWKLLDRSIILCFQLVVGTALAMFLIFFGCESFAALPVFLTSVTVWAVGNFGQIPANVGMFAKLVGRENQGSYQAALFMAMSASRVAAGVLVGSGDLCLSWAVACGFWCVQMAAFLPMYKYLNPPESVNDEYVLLEAA